jgi:hypothetical protein
MSLSSSQEEQRFGYVRYVARSLAVVRTVSTLPTMKIMSMVLISQRV